MEKKEMTFADKEETMMVNETQDRNKEKVNSGGAESESEEELESRKTNREEEKEVEEKAKVNNRPYKKVKHTFAIQVKELKNIPILDKIIKDLN